MTIGDIKAAVAVARTIREHLGDEHAWQQHQTEQAVQALADEYAHADVLYVIAHVAADKAVRAPIMLAVKAPEIVAALHPKPGATAPAPTRENKAWLCFVCGKRRDVCENSAANQGEDRHEFVANRDAEARLPASQKRPQPTHPSLPEDA